MTRTEDFEPWDLELEDLTLDGSTVDSIKKLPDVDSRSAEHEFDYDQERQRAKIKKLKNDNRMRKLFFKWASKLTVGIIAVNSVLFAAYMAVHMWGEHPIPESVMLAWVMSTIIEVLGIVAIIARYLFPGKSRRSWLGEIVGHKNGSS